MTIKFVGLGAVEKDLAKMAKYQDQAVSMAMNEANRTGIKVAIGKQGMRKEWAINATDLKRYTWTKRATRGSLLTQYAIQSRSINLIDFKAKENKKGVSYKLKGKQRTMRGAFIAKGFFFKRTSKKRNSIIPHFSITPTSMFLEADGEDLYVDNYLKRFDERYMHHITRLTK